MKEAKNSAIKLVDIVVKDFKCFNDIAEYKGKTVAIHKRAQILVADLWQLYGGQGLGDFKVCQFIAWQSATLQLIR